MTVVEDPEPVTPRIKIENEERPLKEIIQVSLTDEPKGPNTEWISDYKVVAQEDGAIDSKCLDTDEKKVESIDDAFLRSNKAS